MSAHAEYFNSPSGSMPIRPSIQESFCRLSDREVANKAIRDNGLDPEYFAELVHRDLAGPGIDIKEIFTRIDLKEANVNTSVPAMKMGF